MALQTRSSKFGKLKNGMLIVVSPTLIGRMRHHFASIHQIDLIFGRNGWIWVYHSSTSEVEVPLESRQKIVRVSQIIKLLNISKKTISVESIQAILDITKEIPINDLLTKETLSTIKEVGIIDIEM